MNETAGLPNAHLKDEIDSLVAANRYREAAERLQLLIALEPDCHPAYLKIGVASLRLGEYPAAEGHLVEAARRMPGNSDVFDGLAETCGYLGDVARAREAGRRALVLKDADVPLMLGARPVARPPHGGDRLIAFSLFGAEPRYCETALMNAAAAPDLLPGWTCRFYADDSVPAEVLGRLRAHGAQVVTVEGERRCLPGTMWRFLALDDPRAEAVICRDADSLINARDAGWVRAWIASGRPFHIVRDYFSHCELVLSGLFGVLGGAAMDVEGMMQRFLASCGPRSRWTDQYFLRACLWPLARDAALTHDPWFGYGSHVVPGVGMVADQHDHVGANQASTTMAIDIGRPKGSMVRWQVMDAAGTSMSCRYLSRSDGPRHLISIPRSFGERIRSGAWTVRWEVIGPPA